MDDIPGDSLCPVAGALGARVALRGSNSARLGKGTPAWKSWVVQEDI